MSPGTGVCMGSQSWLNASLYVFPFFSTVTRAPERQHMGSLQLTSTTTKLRNPACKTEEQLFWCRDISGQSSTREEAHLVCPWAAVAPGGSYSMFTHSSAPQTLTPQSKWEQISSLSASTPPSPLGLALGCRGGQESNPSSSAFAKPGAAVIF